MNTQNKKVELSDVNKEHIEEVRRILLDKKIDYTEESIDFVLNRLNMSFEDTVEYSDEHLKIIYMCGLPSHDRKEALGIMGTLRKQGITYREQHQILVKILKEDHFFMGTDQRMNFMNLVANLMML